MTRQVSWLTVFRPWARYSLRLPAGSGLSWQWRGSEQHRSQLRGQPRLGPRSLLSFGVGRRTSKAQGYASCVDRSMFGLGAYPLLRLWPLRVPPLRRVTFDKRLKSNQKVCALTYGPRCRSGSFAPGSIRAHRLRFASLHLLSMCLASPNGRCAPTPGSIPPLSLPTDLAIKSGT